MSRRYGNSGRGRPKVTRHGRSKLMKRDGNCCFYCNKGLLRSNATVDHFIAKTKGGDSRPYNYVIACVECNVEKDDGDPFAFYFKKRFNDSSQIAPQS